MSTTPRTDEAIRKYRFLGSGPLELEGRFADFARELETELAAAKAEAAHYMSVAQKATAELAAEREKVRVLREALEQVGELVEQMVCVPISEEPVVSAKAYGIIALTVAADISADIDAALAAAKEEIK